jgi:hypothetical protein
VETCVPTPGTSADDVLHGRGFCESGPPAPPREEVPEHYANRFTHWFWTHDGPAIVIGAALVVAIVTHKHPPSGHSTGTTQCGPGTGETCPPGAPPPCTNTVGGVCVN